MPIVGSSALYSYSELFGLEHAGATKLNWFAWWACRSGVTGLLTALFAILPGETQSQQPTLKRGSLLVPTCLPLFFHYFKTA
eukprot:4241877-Pyramimonas_sp.AAC.2